MIVLSVRPTDCDFDSVRSGVWVRCDAAATARPEYSANGGFWLDFTSSGQGKVEIHLTGEEWARLKEHVDGRLNAARPASKLYVGDPIDDGEPGIRLDGKGGIVSDPDLGPVS